MDHPSSIPIEDVYVFVICIPCPIAFKWSHLHLGLFAHISHGRQHTVSISNDFSITCSVTITTKNWISIEVSKRQSISDRHLRQSYSSQLTQQSTLNRPWTPNTSNMTFGLWTLMIKFPFFTFQEGVQCWRWIYNSVFFVIELRPLWTHSTSKRMFDSVFDSKKLRAFASTSATEWSVIAIHPFPFA